MIENKLYMVYNVYLFYALPLHRNQKQIEI